jgi:hypothetical protein
MSLTDSEIRLREAGFKPTINRAAVLIEQFLGISYEERPAQMRLNRVNIQALENQARLATPYIRPDDVEDLLEIARGKARKKGGGDIGQYFYEYNLCVNRGRGLLTDYHENAHGLVFSLNPGLVIGYDKNPDLSVAEEEERSIVDDLANEGPADWVVIQLALASANNDIYEEGLYQHAQSVGASSDSLYLTPNLRFLQEQFQKLKLVVTMKSLQERTDFERREFMVNSRSAKKLEEGATSAIYSVGYYFSYTVMALLRERGLKTEDAFRLMVSTPPTKLDEFNDPLSYGEMLYELR